MSIDKAVHQTMNSNNMVLAAVDKYTDDAR